MASRLSSPLSVSRRIRGGAGDIVEYCNRGLISIPSRRRHSLFPPLGSVYLRVAIKSCGSVVETKGGTGTGTGTVLLEGLQTELEGLSFTADISTAVKLFFPVIRPQLGYENTEVHVCDPRVCVMASKVHISCVVQGCGFKEKRAPLSKRNIHSTQTQQR